MGLACSNIRLLTLTQRKADCEYGISIDSMEKMALSREQTELSRQYYSKMQAKSIAYYNNGQYSQMSYEYLMGYGGNYTAITSGKLPLKTDNSMILTDYNGRVVLNASYANAITSVLGSSAMDIDGRGGTFSSDKIPDILGKLIPGYSENDFRDAIAGKEKSSSYAADNINIISGEKAGSSIVNNSDEVNKIINGIVDFYYPIFKSAAANGWTTEYNNDMNPKVNPNYISDALVNGTFQLACADEDGNYKPDISLTYFVTAGLISARTDSDVREEITAWYNAEKERITEKENYLDLEIDNYSTELEAIKTEIQSIQSLIDDAIQSVFDWGS